MTCQPATTLSNAMIVSQTQVQTGLQCCQFEMLLSFNIWIWYYFVRKILRKYISKFYIIPDKNVRHTKDILLNVQKIWQKLYNRITYTIHFSAQIKLHILRINYFQYFILYFGYFSILCNDTHVVHKCRLVASR